MYFLSQAMKRFFIYQNVLHSMFYVHKDCTMYNVLLNKVLTLSAVIIDTHIYTCVYIRTYLYVCLHKSLLRFYP